jgi:hypothetical protein
MKPIPYRVGWPGWRLAEKLGARPYFRVDVMRDPEAKVYVATSTDIRGLVVEASTVDELLIEIDGAVQSLLAPASRHATPDLRLQPPCAA